MVTCSMIFVVILFSPSISLSQYQISAFTVDGGGGISSGDGYLLSGTVGQPEAGVIPGNMYVMGFRILVCGISEMFMFR